MSRDSRYSRHNILRAEQMYGRGFQSPGHLEIMEAACKLLDLRPRMRVLDIGSGVGGAATYLARRHHVEVVGLDTSQDMVELSQERLAEDPVDGVSFILADFRTTRLTPRSFDVVWTRDTMLYMADKEAVWRQVFEALRPNGQLYVTDFCRGISESTATFDTYVESNSYHLTTIGDYAQTLRASGFASVRAMDQTAFFQDALIAEANRLERAKADFLESFGEDDYTYLSERWQQKIDFCRAGLLAWGTFTARR